MKNTSKYLSFALVAVFAVGSLVAAGLGSAQTTTPVTSLGCSASQSPVGIGQVAILTATGGNGNYTWTGQNLNVTNASGTQFAVNYPAAGTYTITVASAGLTANCNVVVSAQPPAGALACNPAIQNVTLGQSATVTATGGDGNYVWSSPDLNISNPNGSAFTANFGSTGLKTLTLRSAGLVTTCAVNVLGGTEAPAPTPGLPNTGAGYGQ